MTTPATQRNKAISMTLTGGGPEIAYEFSIRPEELTYEEPARVNVLQTLGGAWVDDFGHGVCTARVSGHTGWRGRWAVRTAQGGMYPYAVEDGGSYFRDLRDQVFRDFYNRRQAISRVGGDPGVVRLVFADALNGFVGSCVPNSFQLRRHRSRPLLYMYTIQLTFLDRQSTGYDNSPAPARDRTTDAIALALADKQARAAASGTAMSATLDTLLKWASALSPSLAAYVRIVDAVFRAGIETWTNYGGSSSGLSSIANVGHSLAGVGRNAFWALSGVAGSQTDMSTFANIAAKFNTLVCQMRGAWDDVKFVPDYTAILGTSTCSSTSGGSPASSYESQSALDAIATSGAGERRVVVSQSAQAAIASLSGDPLNFTSLPAAEITASLARITTGVVVT